MATTKAAFTVTASDGIQAFWIAVGNSDVPLVNGKGSITLATDRKHTLIWWMVGNSGASIAIVGKDSSGNTVVEVKKSSIPAAEHEGGGLKRFDL